MKVGFMRLVIRSPASRLVVVVGRLWTLAALAELALALPAGVRGRSLNQDAISSNCQPTLSCIRDVQDKMYAAHSGRGEVSVFNPRVVANGAPEQPEGSGNQATDVALQDGYLFITAMAQHCHSA